MGKSIRRDIYLTKAENKAGKDQDQLMRFLAISPYRKHKKMAVVMLEEINKLRKQNDPTEA
jgi:hypothetical protein